MPATGHVIALPRIHDEVQPIRGGLASVGIRSQVRDAEPGRYLVENTTLREEVHSLRNGLLLGLLLGVLVGLVLVLAVPGLHDLPRIGRIVLIGGIALQGTMPTMMWALGRVEHYDDDPELLRQVEPGEQLVVVDSEPDEGRARHLLEHHHVIFLDEDHPHASAA
jgi:hypothetical protein